MLDDAETQPVSTALKETADALTCAVQSRTLLHDAGEWLAGTKFNVPDRPMQQQIEDATELIRLAEEKLIAITGKLHTRVKVLRDGQPRVTRGPLDAGSRALGQRLAKG